MPATDESAAVPRRAGWTETQLFVATLVAAILLYDLVLQMWELPLRLVTLVEPARAGWAAGLALSSMWLAFDVAFALFASVLLLVRDQHGRLWLTVAVLLQAGAFLLGLIDTASHVYFMQTLDALDWPLLRHMFAQPRDLGLLLAGEVTAWQWLLLGIVFVLSVAGPWMVRAWALRSVRPPYLGRERRSRRKAAAAVALGFAVAALGLILPPPLRVKDAALVRSPVLYLALTALGSGPRVDRAVSEAMAEARFFEPGNLTIERTAEGPLRNLVVVVLESIRASATTPYDPKLPTTPFLDSLARRSVVVEKAYAVIPSTAKALTAIFCSLYPSVSLEPRSLTPDLLGRCLPELLREQGYQTVYLQTAEARFENRVQAVRSMGFATFIRPEEMPWRGFERPNFLGFEDDTMLGPSERWLQEHRQGPIFAAYLTVNAHHDYERLTRHGEHHFAPYDDALDRYLNNVYADDAFLQALFAQYERLGLLANTLFVLVGDHGEAFAEHGRRAHNTVPYEEGLRVPLLLHDPSGKLLHPGRVAGPISQLDIMPSALQLLGFRIASGTLHGVSLFDSPPDRVLMMSCMGNCAARVTGTEAFVHHFGRRPDELFDLRTDPLERNDVAGLYPNLVASRAAEIRNFQRRVGSFFFLHTLHAAHPSH